MEDRRLFYDAFYRYYTDYEPEHAFIGEAGGQVIGFILGSLDNRRQMHTLFRAVYLYVAFGTLK